MNIMNEFYKITKARNFNNKWNNIGRRSKIKNLHIKAIKEFIKSHEGQHFTVNEIKIYLQTNFPDMIQLSEWSIRKILKLSLRYSYKKVNFIQKKVFKDEYVRRFFESSIIQLLLINNGYELLYLDEFSINFRNKSTYGWSPIGGDGFVKFNQTQFSMSFMLGFSLQRTYGVYGTILTHNNSSFISFINNALEHRTKGWDLSDTDLVIVWDNSSIHKSVDVKNFASKLKIKILTIWPYCPTLNPAEKMILFIKQKLNSDYKKGRYIF